MSTYAISDIHGCFDQLQALLDTVSPTSDDAVYILGDLTDRGDDGDKVMVWAVDAPDNFHFLLGNHDLMMREVLRRDPIEMPMHMGDLWSINGGYETAESLWESTEGDWRRERLLPFVESLRPYEIVDTEAGHFALVHAGFDPSVYAKGPVYVDAWAEGPDFEVGHGFGTQNEFIMCWVRRGWFDHLEAAPMPCVYGHTPTTYIAHIMRDAERWVDDNDDADRRPSWIDSKAERGRIWRLENKIDIDCGCAYGGNLAALRLEDGEEFYVPGREQTRR